MGIFSEHFVPIQIMGDGCGARAWYYGVTVESLSCKLSCIISDHDRHSIVCSHCTTTTQHS